MQNNGYVWGAVLAILIIIAGVFIFRANKAAAPSPTASSTGMGTTTVDLGNGMVATLPPGVSLTQSTSSAGGTVIQAPSLNQTVTYAPSLSADAVAIIKSDITTLTASLKANPSQSDKWLELAVYYKAAGDYTLAEQVWLYLTKAAPTSSIAFADLGDLYNNFLVNYPKAETYYLDAIKLKPDDINTYQNLFMMYRYQYKTNTPAAANLLAQGLKANPNDPTLLQLQQQLQTKSQ